MTLKHTAYAVQMGGVLQKLLASYRQQPAQQLGMGESSGSSLDLVSWTDDPQHFQDSLTFPDAAYQEPWPPAGAQAAVSCFSMHG